MISESESPDRCASARVEVRNIVKAYPGVRALDRVSMSVGPGEVLSVIGENGAGKSTLMKVLAGIVRPDEGEISMNGAICRFQSPGDALRSGIALIHQELQVVDNLDVGSAIFLGREPTRFGLIQHDVIYRNSEHYLNALGADFCSTDSLSTLAPGQLQLVDIASALSREASVLIMDEPTSSLSTSESGKLFKVVQDLAKRGVSVLYVSHRLAEVEFLSHRVIGLKDGRFSGELNKSEISRDAMVTLMVGREIDSHRKDRAARYSTTPRLEVEDLVTREHPDKSLSFRAYPGEILGIAGLVGSGRTELLEGLYGVRTPIRGTMRIDGKVKSIKNPFFALEAGMALVPEDRKHHGLFLQASIGDNITSSILQKLSRFSCVDDRLESELIETLMKRLGVKATSRHHAVDTLSGGNQQKVVLARCVALDPKIMLMDEPTKGIDVGARHEIYELMEAMSARDMSIVFVSSDMEEVLIMADRVLVMHEGRLSGELNRDEMSEEAIMKLATGTHPSTTDSKKGHL